jgi:hypothetical protein
VKDGLRKLDKDIDTGQLIFKDQPRGVFADILKET